MKTKEQTENETPKRVSAVVRRSVTAKTQFNTDRLELKEYRYKNVTIRTWKRSDGNWSIALRIYSLSKWTGNKNVNSQEYPIIANRDKRHT